jgi:hypothetical protein
MRTVSLQSSRLFRLIACLTTFAVGGHATQPPLVDTLGTLIDEPVGIYGINKWLLAPVIVIASVEEDRTVAKYVEAARYRGVFLDLHLVRCKRENSVKGGLTGSELEFYYFADGRYPDSKPNPRYKQLFEAVPGARYLFFLTRDRDVWRSIGDVGDYSIRLATGTHPQSMGENRDLGRRLTEILLIPQPDADLNLMAGRLHEYRIVAESWSFRLFVAQLLRRLTSLPEPIRSEACGELTQYYHGQEDCLKALAEDTTETPEIRKLAADQWKRQLAERPQLLESLRDPAGLRYLTFVGDSMRSFREELQTMLLGTDTALHERVCTALRRYFPHDPDPKCSNVGRVPGRH